MTAKQTITLGTTIHDEVVTITETGRNWKLSLDGQRLGSYDTFEGIIVRASRLIIEARRTNALPLLPYYPA